MCPGSGGAWVKPGRQTQCPQCGRTIAQIGGHPDKPIPKH